MATLPDGFPPIGGSFAAILDGNLFTIKNLYINVEVDRDRVGLFSESNGATIRRLGLTDVYVVGRSRVGGLIGEATGTTMRSVWVTTGSGNGAIQGIDGRVGGLIGVGANVVIVGSWTNVAIAGNVGIGVNGGLGGLAGAFAAGNSGIHLSYARSDITITGGVSTRLASGLYGSAPSGATSGTRIGVQASWSRADVISVPSPCSGACPSRGLKEPWGVEPEALSGVFYEGTGSSSSVTTPLNTDQIQAVDGANFGGGSNVANRFATNCGGAWIFTATGAAAAYPKLREVITLRSSFDLTNCTGSEYGAELPGQ